MTTFTDDIEQLIIASRHRNSRDPLYLRGNFQVACQSCKHNKDCGKSLITAKDNCRQHAHRFPHHTIFIEYKSIYEIWQDKTMDLTDCPPF